MRTNLEEAPPKTKISRKNFLFLKHAYMFRRFKIFVKIYIYIYVFATFMFYYQFFSCTMERHSGEIKFDTISSLRNMSVIDQKCWLQENYSCLGTFYLRTHTCKVSKVIN